MKIAIISDVHGNRLALEAVLDDISRQSVDSTVNLGDNVSGPMEPGWTCDILMDADFPSVAGNHDVALTTQTVEQMGRVDRFATSHLEQPHIKWLDRLPATMAIQRDIFLCHGTPTSNTKPWLDNWFTGRTTTLPDEAYVAAEAEGFDYQVLVCGHTHQPRSVRLRDGRLVLNPGSVGLQLLHGSPDARYAIVERRDGKWTSALHTVPYDHVAAAKQASLNGFPAWTKALMTGWAGPEGLF